MILSICLILMVLQLRQSKIFRRVSQLFKKLIKHRCRNTNSNISTMQSSFVGALVICIKMRRLSSSFKMQKKHLIMIQGDPLEMQIRLLSSMFLIMFWNLGRQNTMMMDNYKGNKKLWKDYSGELGSLILGRQRERDWM